jgi:hypothetical protein
MGVEQQGAGVTSKSETPTGAVTSERKVVSEPGAVLEVEVIPFTREDRLAIDRSLKRGAAAAATDELPLKNGEPTAHSKVM